MASFVGCPMTARLTLILVLFFSMPCMAQVVEDVQFDGLNRLRPAFLKELITDPIGKPQDTARAHLDALALRRLPAVYHADVKWEMRDGRFTQVFMIDETQTFLPYGYFGQGGEATSRTWQMGFGEFNLFGRGIWWTVDYQYKERHAVSTGLRIPFIGGRPWNAELTVKHWNTVEPLYFTSESLRYTYKNRLVQLGISRTFKLTSEVGIRGALFDETYDLIQVPVMEMAPRSEYFLKSLGQAFLHHDRRRFHFFYLDGSLFEVRATGVYNATLPQEEFYQLDVIHRFFHRIKKRWNLATRIMVGLATNNDSPFSPYVFDSQLNLRGAGDRIVRGTAAGFGSFEMRYTVKDKPGWAVQAVAFSDNGWLREPGQSSWNLEPSSYLGGGLRLHIKRFYDGILRADYGQNLMGKGGGFVLGLGQYF